MMMRCHDDTVMLRSTTSLYGQTCDRGRIWENYDSLHRGYCGWCLAREKWLGCHHDSSPMVDIPGLTPIWVPYMIFSSFHDIKFICIMFSKLYVL